MKRGILTTAAIFAAMMLCAPVTFAAIEWNGDGNNEDWSDADNWDSDSVPTSSDDVVFPDAESPYTVSMDGSGGGDPKGYARTITVSEDCTLDIEDDTVLEIGDDDGRSSTINGVVRLVADGSVLRFMYSHTVSGSGSITGLHSDAELQITTTETLISTTTINGCLTILPVGGAGTTFTNNGVVDASTASSTLEIYPTALGAGSGDWRVTASGATLWFRVGSTSLTGDVAVSDGTLDIDENVETSGDLSQTGGVINVEAGNYFQAS
jgi:hypothetical protein